MQMFSLCIMHFNLWNFNHSLYYAGYHNNDCAYVVDRDVFFAVEKSPNYGQLSGQRQENGRAGERVAIDFALWNVDIFFVTIHNLNFFTGEDW